MYLNNASELVLEYLVNKLKDGAYDTVNKIETEDAIGAHLNVSRSSVRQAIEKLVALGVLKKVQGSGTYVNPFEDASFKGMMYYRPNYERLLSILEFRMQFDSGNTALFVEHASDEDMEQLEENYRLMCEGAMNKDLVQKYEREFHRLIALGTHNVIIIRISEMLNDLLINYADLQYDSVGSNNCLEWHGRILEALRAKNGDMARLCVVQDISNAINTIKNKHFEKEVDTNAN